MTRKLIMMLGLLINMVTIEMLNAKEWDNQNSIEGGTHVLPNDTQVGKLKISEVEFTYGSFDYSSFVKDAQLTFCDYATPFFTNYDYLMSASSVRESLGYQYAKDNYKALTNGMKQNKDKFNFVSHSMGGAFSEGMIRYLAEQGWETSNAVFLNAWDPSKITNKEEGNRIDATCSNDPVQLLSIPLLGKPDIPFSDKRIRMYSEYIFL